MKCCIEWEGKRSSEGYGRLCIRGKKLYAHRAVYEAVHGPIPAGMWIDHICRNRMCINPEHLRIVTPKQNALENSDSISAKNSVKTHCSNGHKFNKKNTYWRIDGKGRICKECCRLRDIKRQHTEKRILSHRRAVIRWSQKNGKSGPVQIL